MKLISTSTRNAQGQLAALFARRSLTYERALPAARRIVNAVRSGGDAALRRYATRLDRISPHSPLRISSDEMNAASDTVPSDFRAIADCKGS